MRAGLRPSVCSANGLHGRYSRELRRHALKAWLCSGLQRFRRGLVRAGGMRRARCRGPAGAAGRAGSCAGCVRPDLIRRAAYRPIEPETDRRAPTRRNDARRDRPLGARRGALRPPRTIRAANIRCRRNAAAVAILVDVARASRRRRRKDAASSSRRFDAGGAALLRTGARWARPRYANARPRGPPSNDMMVHGSVGHASSSRAAAGVADALRSARSGVRARGRLSMRARAKRDSSSGARRDRIPPLDHDAFWKRERPVSVPGQAGARRHHTPADTPESNSTDEDERDGDGSSATATCASTRASSSGTGARRRVDARASRRSRRNCRWVTCCRPAMPMAIAGRAGERGADRDDRTGARLIARR